MTELRYICFFCNVFVIYLFLGNLCRSQFVYLLPTFLFGEGGNSDSVFEVEKTAATIIIAKPLDAEQCSFYNLTVLATDGTNTAYVQVTSYFEPFKLFLVIFCLFLFPYQLFLYETSAVFQ